MKIVMEFEADWVELARTRLVAESISGLDADPEKMLFQYFEQKLKRPSPSPRAVHVASGAQPPAGLAPAFQDLTGKLSAGANVAPHLSKGIQRAGVKDGMLFDWKISHFHLGTTPDANNPNFVERTGPLVYAVVEAADVYVLGILPHGQWSDPELLKIIKDNWPELLSRYALADVSIPEEMQFDAEQIGRLRAAGINVLQQVGDAVVASPGGGVTTAGTSTSAVEQADFSRRYVRELEKEITEEVIAQAFSDAGVQAPERVELRLHWDDGFLVVDLQHSIGVRFSTYPALFEPL